MFSERAKNYSGTVLGSFTSIFKKKNTILKKNQNSTAFSIDFSFLGLKWKGLDKSFKEKCLEFQEC